MIYSTFLYMHTSCIRRTSQVCLCSYATKRISQINYIFSLTQKQGAFIIQFEREAVYD